MQTAGQAAPPQQQPQDASHASGQDQPPGLFLLHRKGPTAFLLADSSGAKHRVTIGDKHACSCCSSTPGKPAASRGPCPHVLFVLQRVCSLPSNSPWLQQPGLTGGAAATLCPAAVHGRDHLCVLNHTTLTCCRPAAGAAAVWPGSQGVRQQQQQQHEHSASRWLGELGRRGAPPL
jgi:hypothetical protein